MTPQQKRLYDIIRHDLETTGISPSVREMMRKMGLKSTSGIVRLLDGLEESGHIIRRPNRARSIQLDYVLGSPKWREAAKVISAARKIKHMPWQKSRTVPISKEAYQALRKAVAKLGAV